ncbi:MAG: hypothetical protein B6D61_09890 [Bacteroidetes bacterium 4484_249]|nr:MAG: hypothetical protein B6D61_09890 [Bacteroidetes bacterium 4484_249]
MIIYITKAEFIEDYTVKLSFNDGMVMLVNLKNSIFNDHRKIFEPLKDVQYFKKFTLDTWTLVWPNGVDFAPEYLYELAVKQNEKAHNIIYH